jgi:hypothetical protein
VAAQFRFVPKLEEETMCKPWLSIKPRFGMLLPGEAAEISFTAFIDNATAQVRVRVRACVRMYVCLHAPTYTRIRGDFPCSSATTKAPVPPLVVVDAVVPLIRPSTRARSCWTTS